MEFIFRTQRLFKLFLLLLMTYSGIYAANTLDDKLQTLHLSLTGLKDKLVVLQRKLGELHNSLTAKRHTSPHTVDTTLLEQLALDLKYYKTNNTPFHSGHLYEHSMWTAMVIDRWFEERNGNAIDSGEKAKDWLDGIDENDRNTLVLAGFLHDVGKAANKNNYYHPVTGSAELNTSKPYLKDYRIYHTIVTHPDDGFNFLKMITPYNLSVVKNASNTYDTDFKGKGRFYFDRMFQALGLSDEQIKIIQILTKVHWNFGAYLMMSSNSQQFLLELKKGVEEVDYKNKMIDMRILLLAIVIGAADVRGAQPEPEENFQNFKNRYAWFHPDVFEYPTEHKQCTSVKKFTLFNYATKGVRQRNLLLSFFKTHPQFALLSDTPKTPYFYAPPFLYSSTMLTDCYEMLDPSCC